MNLENKKQVAIIVLAVGLGLVAAVLTGNHIQGSIETETAKLSKEFEEKKMKPLYREIENMSKEIKELKARPVGMAQGGPDGKRGSPDLPKTSLALRTPAGKRAYTVLIDSLSAVGGLIGPGDYVDVIAHMEMPIPQTNKKEHVSSVVFQNVQILAVGTNLQAPGGYEKQQAARSLNITMALSPEEAGLMSFIEKNGKMQFMLRAPAETEIEMLQASTWGTLADYVFEKQGTELVIPRGPASIEAVEVTAQEEAEPIIKVWGGGKQR